MRLSLSMMAMSALSVILLETAVSADATLAGTWSASPLTETITVTSWVDECGPRPKAQSLAGGSYKVSTSGDELVFSGGQPFRTDACFLQEGTRRVSHSATPALRTWKTRCESAPGDPRKASITTVVRAQSDDVIVLTESAHYSSVLSTGTCAADIERFRTYSIVLREGATAPSTSSTVAASSNASSGNSSGNSSGKATPSITAVAPSATKSAPSPLVCDAPGPPASVEVRPKRKILRPGEQFDFKARVLDAAGCEVPSKLAFRIAPEAATVTSIDVETNGHVLVHADAEPVAVAILVEGAATGSDSFSKSAKNARVELEVVTDQRYAELLGTAGLDDAGIDDQTVSVIVSSDANTTTVVTPQPDEGPRRKFAWVAIAFGSATLLGLAALVSFRGRSASKARRAIRPVRSSLPSRAVDAAPFGAEPRVTGPAVEHAIGAATILVCSSCGGRYPEGAAFCPIDGQRLIAVSDPRGLAGTPSASVESARPADRPLGRICPVCGKHYPRDAGFCGQDGVELVPLN